MVKINSATSGIADNNDFVSLASLCVMFCMVITLLGVKFRWFKHRMTFVQIEPVRNSNDTVNSVASSSLRESQQFREPVIIQGVFRKLQEDELEYERPKILPPVRIRKSSKSPPSLLSPTHNEIHAEIQQFLQPPQAPPLPSNNNDDNHEPLPKERAIDCSPHTSPVEERQKEPAPPPPPMSISKKSNTFHDSDFNSKKYEDVQKKQIAERRPTGFARLTGNQLEELEALGLSLGHDEDNSDSNDKSQSLHHYKVMFQLDNDDDEGDRDTLKLEDAEAAPSSSLSFPSAEAPKPMHRTTKMYKKQEWELEEQQVAQHIDDDSWSAVRRHRDLTQEFSQHSQTTFRNPLAMQLHQQDQQLNSFGKPRPMRQIKTQKQQQSSNGKHFNFENHTTGTQA